MAYGSWSSYKWEEIWNNGSYALDVQWRHRIDPINNLIWYSACQWRIRKVASQWFYDADCPIGMGVITETRVTGTTSVNLQNTSSVSYDFKDVGREITANSSGVARGTYYLHAYCKPSGVTGPVPTGWYTKDITDKLPKIDRSGGTTTVSLKSKTYNSITVNYESSVLTTLIQYRIDGGAWIDAGVELNTSGGGKTSFTISGLSPNTAYKLEFRHRRDYNQVYSTAKSLDVTTNKPNLPTMSSLDITGNVYNAQSYSWSGGYGAGHPSGKYGYYRYRTNGGEWVKSATNSVTLSRSPNTSYKFEVQLVDAYGQGSNILSRTDTTPKPSAPTIGAIDVSVTYKSATFTQSGSIAGAGASISKYQYSNDNVVWTDTIMPCTIATYEPNKDYEIYFRVVDNFGTVSASKIVTFTTAKPPKPTSGTVTIANTTATSVRLNISDFISHSNAILDHYSYKLNDNDWVDIELSTFYDITDLMPNTEYSILFHAVDNYGTSSDDIRVTFTTERIAIIIKFKHENTWKQAVIWVKLFDNWVQGNKIYIKQDIIWKEQ